MNIQNGHLARHPIWGEGTVKLVESHTAIVAFGTEIKSVLLDELTPLQSIEAKLATGQFDGALETICRVQAEAITSTNARWGIFARSKIDLLPHQLWVCHRVNQSWPARWLIADDVGLGKTIEAGLIALSQVARGNVKRVLVLCPAPLVEQWRARLREMFGLKMLPYSPDLDGPNGTFWEDQDAIIASLDTIKIESSGRKKRILNAPPFDLLIVDEAHRLGSGPRETTQAYRLVKTLMDSKRVASALFFTGTPHRGHDWGFYALLQLLRPEWFDPRRGAQSQLSRLPDALIRNNKARVTNMEGKRLFQDVRVESATYSYSPDETRFYERLTEFISSGQLYASYLDGTQSQAVMLVLVAMQKLASSSVAAIKGAIETRLRSARGVVVKVADLSALYQRAQDDGDEDALADLEAQLVGAHGALQLVEGEENALRQLLNDAESVGSETKIARILQLVEERFDGRSVLFFTEYKATQRLILEALFARYGDDCATFINGDNALPDVTLSDGRTVDLKSPRAEAADAFNAGEARFLISTEAGGEGIDLQKRCHCLIHVDLPWNPMRLHQRVGRLNRYGQTERVEVVSLRNPDTVESLVWEHLNAKLGRISQSLNAAMDAPEDLLQLVLGMQSARVWNGLFAEARSVDKAQFANWFDAKTHKLGGQDAVAAVQELVGNASHFDFGAHAGVLPRVDLPDLKQFLSAALSLCGHRLLENRFITPRQWKENERWGLFLPDEHSDISFDRKAENLDREGRRLIGAGHNALEAALEWARALEGSACVIPHEISNQPLATFRVFDGVSSIHEIAPIVVGVCGQEFEMLEDWQVLKKINEWSGKNALREDTASVPIESALWLETARAQLNSRLEEFGFNFKSPIVEILCIFIPTKSEKSGDDLHLSPFTTLDVAPY